MDGVKRHYIVGGRIWFEYKAQDYGTGRWKNVRSSRLDGSIDAERVRLRANLRSSGNIHQLCQYTAQPFVHPQACTQEWSLMNNESFKVVVDASN